MLEVPSPSQWHQAGLGWAPHPGPVGHIPTTRPLDSSPQTCRHWPGQPGSSLTTPDLLVPVPPHHPDPLGTVPTVPGPNLTTLGLSAPQPSPPEGPALC